MNRPSTSTIYDKARPFTAWFLLAWTALSVVSGCNGKTSPVVLQREWTANAEFAGDVWAEDLPRQHGPQIVVREGSELLDPIKAVRSGDAQFGVASADRVLRENEGGADLVILAASTYKSPVVLLSHPGAHIATPADLRNHTIGIQTGTNTELVLKSLLRSQHLLPDQMKIVDSGWGTTSFESGAIDVVAAFDYDEPVQLTRRAVAFTVLRPEDYGVRYVGTVYFTRRALINGHPELVQDFMNRLTEGWRLTLQHPSEAIDRLANHFKDVDKEKEAQSLTRGRDYFQGEDGHLLYASDDRWNKMATDLIALHVLRSFRLDSNVDYRFLENALHQGSAR